MSRSLLQPMEFWAGVEPTVSRIEDRYSDQSVRTGHHDRPADLELLADLGVQAVRYPVLWERTAPDGLDTADWTWTDARLSRLQQLKLRPIVGLVHHGSGPRDTSLLDPAFPDRLARYAAAVAQRYPWLEDYTPVNEPLTTARFSALYGHWYPHARDDHSFAVALVTQCRAVIEAMRAIRAVNPRARLIQTEDLGKTYSTPRLAYQAAFDNERRWVSWDLLTGCLDRHSPIWAYLIESGIGEAELSWFQANACPPDVLGINSYVTSERVLDEDVQAYPADRRGGNGRDAYADMEASRVRLEGTGRWGLLVQEAWDRYHLPLALTEVHLGGPRDEQLRWLFEAWQTCHTLRQTDAVDVRAVTAWSAFGGFDWNHLLTCDHGFYEPGLFDIRAPSPRPTALAGLVKQLARGEVPRTAILQSPGWWVRADRFMVRPLATEARAIEQPASAQPRTSESTTLQDGRLPPPLLITGASGTLGSAFKRLCDHRGLSSRLLTRAELDIANPASVEDALRLVRPWAVINTAGYVRVDEAEIDEARCFRENSDGPAVLAAACQRAEIPLVTFSSDLVFDGRQETAYVEGDRPHPLNVYGRSKADAERRVLDGQPRSLVVRTSAFFGPWDTHNFVHHALRALAQGEEFLAAEDQTVSPTYVPDLVHATLDLLIDGEVGIWHLANVGSLSWADLAALVGRCAGLSTVSLRRTPTMLLDGGAVRPRQSALRSERGWIMPTLEDAVERYLVDTDLWRTPATS